MQQSTHANGRLFALPSSNVPVRDAENLHATGVAAEMRLIAELLERGHKVALPVVDDDGVDLVVDYSITVQVKSTARIRHGKKATLEVMVGRQHPRTGPRTRRPLAEHVDVLAVYGRDTQTWWFIPRDCIGNRTQLRFSDHPRSTFGSWRDAWEVFDG